MLGGLVGILKVRASRYSADGPLKGLSKQQAKLFRGALYWGSDQFLDFVVGQLYSLSPGRVGNSGREVLR